MPWQSEPAGSDMMVTLPVGFKFIRMISIGEMRGRYA
jgi:hypothetical protein